MLSLLVHDLTSYGGSIYASKMEKWFVVWRTNWISRSIADPVSVGVFFKRNLSWARFACTNLDFCLIYCDFFCLPISIIYSTIHLSSARGNEHQATWWSTKWNIVFITYSSLSFSRFLASRCIFHSVLLVYKHLPFFPLMMIYRINQTNTREMAGIRVWYLVHCCCLSTISIWITSLLSGMTFPGFFRSLSFPSSNVLFLFYFFFFVGFS